VTIQWRSNYYITVQFFLVAITIRRKVILTLLKTDYSEIYNWNLTFNGNWKGKNNDQGENLAQYNISDFRESIFMIGRILLVGVTKKQGSKTSTSEKLKKLISRSLSARLFG
jgi:hypothetical protein